MLNQGEDFIIRPIEADNPALEYGMSTEKFIKLGIDQQPVIKKDVITYHLIHQSRDGSSTMGTFLKG